ncbi:hypothetical protein [Nostoc sp.]|uniref:hypothetical protein n=1 Tax=Nostoc sp. TaxID=1180 RepID=UPI002FF802AE
MKNICRSEYIYRSSVIGFISSLGTIIFFCGVSHPTFAQSTAPTGVTIPPNTPERVEETIPKPIEFPLPTPEITETLLSHYSLYLLRHQVRKFLL